MHLTVHSQSSDVNTLTAQQKLHYNLLHLQHLTGLESNLNSPKTDEEKFVENFYKTVFLRTKTCNQLHAPSNTQKRLSDSMLTSSHRLSQLDAKQKVSNNCRHSLFLPRLATINQHPQSLSQKIFVLRHGERVDSKFGTNWIDQVFDRTTGMYHRINVNLPKKMVKRKDYKDFLIDPPLTEFGLYQCKLVGEELVAQGIQIDHIYSSPALRCVQTADKILEGLKKRDQIPIRIEPCLFEFLKWYPVVPVKWPFLDVNELIENGYNIDRSYKAFYPMESLRKDEDELMFYSRSHLITTSILKNHPNIQGNILLIGHASTIEVCTRQLTGGQPRIHDLQFLALRVPFLAMHCVEKQTDGTWKTVKPPITPSNNGAIEPFDWRFFR